jgi:proteasome lid subunit RPN8/RPN11
MGGSVNYPMIGMTSGLCLTHAQCAQMERDVSSKDPEEACGFVAGIGNQAHMVIPVTNMLHERYRFRMAPEEQIAAYLMIEENGWEILAIYHSHPNGIDQPSATDLKELTFPGIIYLIWYQVDNQWKCSGFLMKSQTQTYEIPIVTSTYE